MKHNCWITSTYSNSNGCVQVGVARTSSFSTTNGSVEVEGLPNGWVAVRDSKNKTGNGEILTFSPQRWEEILDEINTNEFDWRIFNPLIFDDNERHAFVLGVRDGEFNLEKETV